MKYHPDRNPDPKAAEEFKKISEAYTVLSNDDKRKVYDQYGSDGIDAMNQGGMGGAGGPSPEEIFAQFFGGEMPGGMGGFGGFGGMGGGRRARRSKPSRTPDVEHIITADLEDFYAGKSIKLDFHRRTTCGTCNGTGAKPPHKPSTCTACKGSGSRMQVLQMGPGMIQQVVSECDACDGTGEAVNPKHKCTDCNGAKTVKKPKRLNIVIEPGMRPGETITFAGDAHEEPGAQTGDVVIRLKQKPHKSFKRIRGGDDLYMEKNITLAEALGGFELKVTHLDGRTVIVKPNPASKVLKPGDVKMISGEGMPQTGIPTRRGNLYIRFNVDFPDIPFLKAEELDIVTKNFNQKKSTTASTAADPSGSKPAVAQLVDVSRDTFQFEPLDDGSSSSGNGSRQQQQQGRSSRGREDGPQNAQCAQM